jgi:prepilin-type N-terminal cleavage/methylation domain-containing protein
MNRQRGVTLVELISAIIVISVAGSALVGTLSYLSTTSSQALIQALAQSVADAYLSLISSRSFADPDGADGEPSSDQFDDVDDFNGLVESAGVAFGNPTGNLRVRVNLFAGGLGSLPAGDVWRIEVTVEYLNGEVIATGYRTRQS